MIVSEYIASALFDLGVRHVFGYQGANITYLVDAVSTHGRLQYVQNYHEQGAAFAANGYAQATENLGVVLVSSGPGALNLVTGIANAYCDSIPTLFICGDLSRRYQKNSLPLRQDGFQSADIVSVVRPITKYAELIPSPSDVRYYFERAIGEAIRGRRGPALLAIPHWIQRSELNPSELNSHSAAESPVTLVPSGLRDDIPGLIARSRRPLILVGGGCANARTRVELAKFLDANPLPVVASLCGLSAIAHDHPSFLGFIGDYGHRHANLALAASDCLIVLGSRMDERQIGFLGDSLGKKRIIHVDIDSSELLAGSDRYVPVLGTAADFLMSHGAIIPKTEPVRQWMADLRHLAEKFPVTIDSPQFAVDFFISRLFTRLDPHAQVYVDVGLHQMCAAQFGTLTDGKQLFFSSGLGSMGYAVPACIGGKYAKPERQTICIAGDGGFMMSIAELQVISRDRLNVKVFVLNNHCLGMVRNHQNAALNGRYFGSVDGYLAGDMEKIAQAFDLSFHRIGRKEDVDLLDEVLGRKEPVLVEVVFQNDMMPFPASVNYPLSDDLFPVTADQETETAVCKWRA